MHVFFTIVSPDPENLHQRLQRRPRRDVGSHGWGQEVKWLPADPSQLRKGSRSPQLCPLLEEQPLDLWLLPPLRDL